MAGPDRGAERRVTGVLLAAGQSRRFGANLPKQLYRIRGETLVCRVARAALASKLDRLLVVAGHRSADVGAALAGLALEVIINPDFASGQSTSVKAGLARIGPEADAALFIPCDLPNLDARVLDRLLDAYCDVGAPIVVPVAGGCRFAPTLLDRSLFPEIERISGDQGARQLFPAHESDILEVEFDSATPFEDLDEL